jgi:hypothetical protein
MQKRRLAMWVRVSLIMAVMFLLASSSGVWAETLKVGVLLDYGFPLHVMYKNELDAIVPDFNKRRFII